MPALPIAKLLLFVVAAVLLLLLVAAAAIRIYFWTKWEFTLRMINLDKETKEEYDQEEDSRA